MNTSSAIFTQDLLSHCLQGLCAAMDSESAIPQPAAFSGTAETVKPADILRERLTNWLGDCKGISGWLLTTEALHLFPAAASLCADIPLHAELHRSGDDVSLNLRHTPQGWIWEELKKITQNNEGATFIEEKPVMIDPSHANGDENQLAHYEIEWRLDSSVAPATFRPVRNRFIGWEKPSFAKA